MPLAITFVGKSIFTVNNEEIWTSTLQHLKAKIEIKEHFQTFFSACLSEMRFSSTFLTFYRQNFSFP